MKIAEFRDQIDVVGDIVEDDELVQISLSGFSPPWHNFVQVICGREQLPNFEQLWDAFIGENIRLHQVSTNHEDVLNRALVEKARKEGKK